MQQGLSGIDTHPFLSNVYKSIASKLKVPTYNMLSIIIEQYTWYYI